MPKLTFKHRKEIAPVEYHLAENLIKYIYKVNSEGILPTGSQLANAFKTSQAEIRKVIQIIREHNNEFFKTSYLISHSKGYEITNDKKIIAKWAEKQHLRGVSALSQVEQAWKITKKGW